MGKEDSGRSEGVGPGHRTQGGLVDPPAVVGRGAGRGPSGDPLWTNSGSCPCWLARAHQERGREPPGPGSEAAGVAPEQEE